MKEIDFFLNDYYQILKVLINNETMINNKKCIPISQDDIAEQTHFSKAKVNKFVRVLISKGYVKVIKQGRYCLDKRAYDIYNFLNRIN